LCSFEIEVISLSIRKEIEAVTLLSDSAAADTCTAMDEWVRYPQAETALSNLLPCVDERTTNRTLYQSKEVVVQMVKIVNRVISSIGRSQSQRGGGPQYRRKYKPPLPYLCSPYDTDLQDRECKLREVPVGNASVVCTPMHIFLLSLFFFCLCCKVYELFFVWLCVRCKSVGFACRKQLPG
jgi:hypothetical protein